MKKITHIAFLLVALVLLAAAGAGCTAKAKKIYHLSRADKFYDAGKLDRAEIEYLNVLRNDPANARAYGRLGVIYYDEGRLQRAVFFLGKGSAMATNDLNLRLKLGFIYSAFGKFQEARDAANYVLDHQPQDDEAPLLLAEASLKPKEVEAARQRLQTLIRSGDRAALEVAVGNLFFREHNLTNAETAFRRAQTLDPKSSAVNAALGTLSWAQNDLKTAAAGFKAAAEASSVRSPRRMQYVQFKIRTGDIAGGRQLLDEIIKQAPDYIPALMVAAEIAASEKKFDECGVLLGKVLAQDENNFNAMLFDARLKLAQVKVAEAAAELERMARVYPQVAQVHYELATAYLAGGDMVKGMESLTRALDLAPDFAEAVMLMSQVQIKSGNPNPVIISLTRLLKKQPQLVPAQLLLADAYRLQGRPNDALAVYASLEKSFPTNVQLPLLVGSVNLELKDDGAARKAFSRALEIAPENLPALEQLVDLDVAAKQFDAALQRVNRELAGRPKQGGLYLLVAKIFMTQGNAAQAETTLLKAIELEPKNPGAYRLLAQMYFNAGENQKALAKLDAAIALAPKAIPALMLAAAIHSADKDYPGAAAAYEKILLVDPKFSPALNNLAYLYSENLGKLDRAYELAQNVRELLPFDPATADTLGWISLKRGTYAVALSLLKEAAAKLPDEAEVQFHLGMANYMLDEEPAAGAALQRALQISKTFPGHEECERALSLLAINPPTADAAAQALLEKRVAEKTDDPVALGRLAAIYQRAGNFDKAIAAYESILKTIPNHLAAINSLTRLYAPKDVKKAYEMAKAAYKLAPDDPEVSHALGRLAYRSGDYKLSVGLLQETVKKQADDALVWFDLAEARYSLGRISEARTAMQNALPLNPPAPQSGEARRFLELTSLAADPAQAAAARLRISEILKSEPDYVPVLMVQAVISQNTGNFSEAAVTYERILNQYPDFAPAQKQLAIIYAKDSSKLDKAFELATKARETMPDDLELTRILGMILVQKSDYARAAGLLKQSPALISSDPESLFYLGKAQFQLKNRTESKVNLQQALALKLSGKEAEAAKQMLGELK